MTGVVLAYAYIIGGRLRGCQVQSSQEILQNKKPSNITEGITSNITTVKNSNEVRRIAIYLNDILKPDHDMLDAFMKYAWRYDEPILVRLAITAKEKDKQGNPARLFNFLVKEELGYSSV